jgi:drug/metabolite transporter (DMT)-like permease
LPIPARIKSEFPFAVPAGRQLIYVLVLGIVNSGFACLLYFSSMQRLPGQTVALCCYVDPLSAVIFSALFLGERMTPVQIVGAALVLGGAMFGELRLSGRKAAEERLKMQLVIMIVLALACCFFANAHLTSTGRTARIKSRLS